jgi:outer membrane protein assembly factor BamB
MGATAIVTAWDAETGRVAWRRDFSGLVDFSQLFCGTAASPVMAHGLAVVQVGSDVHGGTIAGLDPATGETRWEWRGPGPGYASPAVIEAGGVSQILTLTNESVIGLDARTGQELWTTSFPNAYHENIATPVWTGSLLVASNKEQGTVAYRLTQVDDGWQVREVWRTTTASLYMSSPVVADGTLFGFSDKRRGSFVAIDLDTGEPLWHTEGREATQAGLLIVGRHVVALTDEARLIVAPRDAGAFAPIHEYDLGVGPTWGVPILTGGDLILREGRNVTRLRPSP